jgi:hypothetical protein
VREAEAMQRAGTWPVVNNDPFFNSVALQLPFNGANGSTTFVDQGPLAVSVTAFGATISTAQSRSGGASAIFGTNQYLRTADGPFDFSENQDFTIEMWIYPTTQTASYRTVFSNYESFNSSALALWAGVSGVDTTKWIFLYAGEFPPSLRSTTSIASNSWTHLAIVRASNVITLFVNGVAESTRSVSSASVGTGGFSYIGAAGDSPASTNFNGHIDDLRVTKDVARYTSNFTPSSPLF